MMLLKQTNTIHHFEPDANGDAYIPVEDAPVEDASGIPVEDAPVEDASDGFSNGYPADDSIPVGGTYYSDPAATEKVNAVYPDEVYDNDFDASHVADDFDDPELDDGFAYVSSTARNAASKTAAAAKTAANRTTGAAKNVASRISAAKQAASAAGDNDETVDYSVEDAVLEDPDENPNGPGTGEQGQQPHTDTLWKSMKRSWLAYYPAHRNTVAYGVVGFASAILILTVGFWPIFLIAVLTVLGNVYGRYQDNDPRIAAFFRRLFKR